MASVGALLDHIVKERALSDFDDDGIGGLDIRNIETLTLCVRFPLDSLPFVKNTNSETNSCKLIKTRSCRHNLSKSIWSLFIFISYSVPFKFSRMKAMHPYIRIKRKKACRFMVSQTPTIELRYCNTTLKEY